MWNFLYKSSKQLIQSKTEQTKSVLFKFNKVDTAFILDSLIISIEMIIRRNYFVSIWWEL